MTRHSDCDSEYGSGRDSHHDLVQDSDQESDLDSILESDDSGRALDNDSDVHLEHGLNDDSGVCLSYFRCEVEMSTSDDLR